MPISIINFGSKAMVDIFIALSTLVTITISLAMRYLIQIYVPV